MSVNATDQEITYKTIHYADGWVEIRETENPEAWIATNLPSSVDD